MKIVSLFSGAGGMDLGFRKAGFEIIWANEFDATIHETYERNHPGTALNKNDIRTLGENDIPDCEGIIGGPPCQSWSVIGNQKGLDDKRGMLFFEFIRVLKLKQPSFFVAENVKGILMHKHRDDFNKIIKAFFNANYDVSTLLLNAADYGVPQHRQRVFIIGIRKHLNLNITPPEKLKYKKNLRDAIGDLKDTAIPAVNSFYTNGINCYFPNHEYISSPFPEDYANSDKVKNWECNSHTIRATGIYALPHPSCPHMSKNHINKYSFKIDEQHLCRRLSVRECARIQTFPDDFIFYYNNLINGYKMVGNAVPVDLAFSLANILKKNF